MLSLSISLHLSQAFHPFLPHLLSIKFCLSPFPSPSLSHSFFPLPSPSHFSLSPCYCHPCNTFDDWKLFLRECRLKSSEDNFWLGTIRRSYNFSNLVTLCVFTNVHTKIPWKNLIKWTWILLAWHKLAYWVALMYSKPFGQWLWLSW